MLMLLQPWAKYLKLWFSCEIVHYKKSSISFFQEFFESVDKILIFGGRLSNRLQFYEVLRSL